MSYVSSLYLEWANAWNKDEPRYYDDPDFRRDYTREEMDGKANLFKQKALSDVQAVLTSIWSQTNRGEIRILSLGCGPGSDLLGILGAVDSVLRSAGGGLGWRTGELECHCTGVDAFAWNRDDFRKRVTRLRTASVLGGISYRFVHQDMETFALNCLRESDYGREFDFICLSFADAGRNLQLICTVLPHLLSEFGRILVLDNDIPTVKSLAQYGFSCTFASNGICFHRRGRGIPGYRGTYQPSRNSPIQLYRQKKAAAEEQARLQEQLRRQSAESFRTQTYNYQSVYPHSQRQTSWCECPCSIL